MHSVAVALRNDVIRYLLQRPTPQRTDPGG